MQVSHMGKVDTSFQDTDHVRQVIGQIRTVGTGAEGDTIVYVIHCLHQPQDILLGIDDTGKAEHTPGRVIGWIAILMSYLLHTGMIALRK